MIYCILRNIRPRFIFDPFALTVSAWANLRLDEHKYLTLSLFKPNLVWANSSLGETVCNCRKAKILWGENNPVYF